MKTLLEIQPGARRRSFLVAAPVVIALAFVAAALSACLVGEDGEELETLEPDYALVPVCEDEPEKFAPESKAAKTCCGNDDCESGETAITCAKDCARCGDGACSSTESPRTCPSDCGSCGNDVCESHETAFSCAADCGLPKTVRLDRVRYCRSWLFCNGTTTYPEYSAWRNAGVNNDHQKLTLISKYSDPPKSKVKRIVFVSSGQQLGSSPSSLTGQKNGYKSNFGARSKTKTLSVNRALPHRLIEKTGWNPDETFVGVAFDARFHLEFSKNEKSDVENAYFQWLKSKFNPSSVRSIYLAGHSRGGCLVARLGARFVAEFPNVPVIVHVFDGVCSRSSGLTHSEFGVTSDTIESPVSIYRAYKTNITSRFSNRSQLAFFNLVSGHIIFGARAFTHHTATGKDFDSGGARPWLKQRWYNENHVNMENLSYQVQALDHLVDNCDALGC